MKVIVDHDGGIDDFPALSLLLCAPSVGVVAVTVMPADSYKEPAVAATKKFVDFLGAKGVSIAASDFIGINPFPDLWRRDAYRMATLGEFETLADEPSNRVVKVSAEEHLVELLSGNDRFTILATGPLSNLAKALKRHQAIAEKIERIYFMGGAVCVKGNVEHEGHDGTAEWNIFNDPPAADVVFRSGIPITMVPLDATNQVPLTRRFLDCLRANSHYPACRLAHSAWSLAEDYIDQQGYYLWDTLTAAAVINPNIVVTKPMRIVVVTSGPSQGRTIESTEGTLIDVAMTAQKTEVEALLLRTWQYHL